MPVAYFRHIHLSERTEMIWQNKNANVEALWGEGRAKVSRKEAKSRALPKSSERATDVTHWDKPFSWGGGED